MVDLEEIRGASLLAGLSRDDVLAIGELGELIEVAEGHYLFRLGDVANTFFILQRGRIELTLPLLVRGEETEVVVEELGVGDSLAWSALIAPHSMTMSARAIAPCRLIALARADLERLFAEQPALGRTFMANLAGLVGRRLRVSQAMWVGELQEHVSRQYG
jgi:CRP-like cAMP-binding protein